jgi:hypothetical protein
MNVLWCVDYDIFATNPSLLIIFNLIHMPPITTTCILCQIKYICQFRNLIYNVAPS